MTEDTGPAGDDAVVGNRWPEVIVAGVLLGLALLVISDSLRVGIGWADDGPRSGYFPFYIGVALALSSGAVLVGQLLRWKAADPEFARRSQLSLVIAVFVPMVIYVAGINLLGIYVASTLLIAYFMVRHGKYGAVPTLGVSLGTPLVFFLVFERWFLVQLPKGPLENLLGL
jgi:hypothetical protein